ncbi:MAG: hypothetical protein AB7I34_08050 [Rhizobiaceae bacterium]
MRYTIVIVGLMIFFIWDGMYNNGIYLDHSVRFLRSLIAMVGL